MENEIRELIHPQLTGDEQIAELVMAFLQSNTFFHQELTIMNPDPMDYDPQYVVPRDVYTLVCNVDATSEAVPTLEEIRKAVARCGNILCIGSHRHEIDRTFQLFYVGYKSDRPSLLLRQLDPSADLETIGKLLLDEWMAAQDKTR